MKASVDPDLCAGHGVCVATCPEVFTLTDDGYAEAVAGEIPGEFAGLVEQAASQCPTRAITAGTR